MLVVAQGIDGVIVGKSVAITPHGNLLQLHPMCSHRNIICPKQPAVTTGSLGITASPRSDVRKFV